MDLASTTAMGFRSTSAAPVATIGPVAAEADRAIAKMRTLHTSHAYR
jgi:hypothetical protein